MRPYFAGIVGTFLLLFAGCSRQPAKSQVEAARKPDPLPVKTIAAETRHADQFISVTGSLNPDETVSVSFEVAGRVAAIPVDFGQNVRKGQVIAELDKQEYQLRLESSKASLAQALARLGLNPGEEDVPPESTPAMRQATAQLEDAKFKYESAARLVKTGDVSQERFTELEKAYRARQAAFEMTRDEKRMLWASMESLRADVKLAQKRLNDTVVRAPMDGAVTQRQVSAGQYIKENTAVVTLVKANPMRLLVDVPESAAGEVRIGTTLTCTTDAVPGASFPAVVRQLNPSLDSKTRSLTVEARLNATDDRLRPGMFVQVHLITARNAAIVMVPKQALYTVAGLTKLFVIRDNRAVEFKVGPGQEIDGWIEVPAGQIRAGDQVAVSNLPQLVNGSEVSVTRATARVSRREGACRS